MPFPENIIPDTYPIGNTTVNAQQVISNASNVIAGTNPSYTVADFITVYPQFSDGNGGYLLPQSVLQMYIDLANASVIQQRYQAAWQMCMGLFIAHFATLYLQSAAAAGSPAAKVIALSEAKGLRTSKSVGDVSTSVDYNAIAADLDGWAAWKLTTYGQQFATMAKMVGKGGMMIW